MPELPSIDETIGNHARALSEQLQAMSLALFPPASQKELRRFSSGEAAKLISGFRFPFATALSGWRGSSTGSDAERATTIFIGAAERNQAASGGRSQGAQ